MPLLSIEFSSNPSPRIRTLAGLEEEKITIENYRIVQFMKNETWNEKKFVRFFKASSCFDN